MFFAYNLSNIVINILYPVDKLEEKSTKDYHRNKKREANFQEKSEEILR